MRLKTRLSSAITLAMLATTTVLPQTAIAADLGTITYDGNDYTISTTSGTYNDLKGQLQEQLWWGDSNLTLTLWHRMSDEGFLASTPNYYMAHTDNLDGTIDAARINNTGWARSIILNTSDTHDYLFASLLAAQLTLADVQASLNSTNLGLQSTLATTGTLVNGAHSRPMSRRVDTGKKTFWVAGDWGNDNHHERDGRVGLTEVGGGYNFGPAQMNISLGKTWASQDLIHNGDVDSDGKYIMVEGIVPLSVDNGIYATIGTYYHWGDMDIDRGYLNMGNLDQSSASPDTDTWGVRARVDWENAFTLSTARFSPYADLWHSKTKLDSYTETGGGFPAHFNSREDRITELRAGLNAAMPINQSNFDFIANIEGVHRFDDKADSTSGQVVGLFAFNLEGEDYDQNWLKGGVGIEGVMGDGKVSLMLNGTTKGEMASSWVAASYQMSF